MPRPRLTRESMLESPSFDNTSSEDSADDISIDLDELRRRILATDSESSFSNLSHDLSSAPSLDTEEDERSNSAMSLTFSDDENTEEYDVARVLAVIDAQPAVDAQPAIDEDEDDVILIEPQIETINLCTQNPTQQNRSPRRRARRNAVERPEVIEIVDSPMMPPRSRTGPTRRNRLNAARDAAAPYVPSVAAPSTSDVSLDSTQTPAIRVSCPVCFESVVGKNPVSTTCGHIFCSNCLQNSLRVTKACPMCRKKLVGRAAFHPIHLGI